MRGSGLPSPVLKLAWQRRHTYIFELDIIWRAPGSEAGRAAEYSACVWRNFCAESEGGVFAERVAMMKFSRQVDHFQARTQRATETVSFIRGARLSRRKNLGAATAAHCPWLSILVGVRGFEPPASTSRT